MVIATATVEEIVRRVDVNILACIDGGINLTKTWARSLLNHMGMVKRRVNSKAKVDIENFIGIKEEFLLDVIFMDKITPTLIFSMYPLHHGLWIKKS